jgi:hypothetical protein
MHAAPPAAKKLVFWRHVFWHIGNLPYLEHAMYAQIKTIFLCVVNERNSVNIPTIVAFMRERLGLFVIWLVCIGVAWVAGWRMLWAIFTNRDSAWKLAMAYDLLGNVVTNGRLGETISARAGRAQREGRPWACVLCRLLDYIERDHCAKAFQAGERDPNSSANK